MTDKPSRSDGEIIDKDGKPTGQSIFTGEIGTPDDDAWLEAMQSYSPALKRIQEMYKNGGSNVSKLIRTAEIPMKTDDGVDFPKEAYAYTPSDTPSDWKLRLWEDPQKKQTPRQIGLAAAALSRGGFRGRSVQIPTDAKPGVLAKVRAAWKSVNPDKEDSDMPEQLKAAEPKDKPLGDNPETPKAADEMDMQMSECPECGAEVPEDEDTCPECGADMTRVEKKPKKAAEPKGKPTAKLPEDGDLDIQNDEPGSDDLHVPAPVQAKKTKPPAKIPVPAKETDPEAEGADGNPDEEEQPKADERKQSSRMAYLEKMHEKMRECVANKGYVSTSDYAEIQKHARSHAGGLFKKQAAEFGGDFAQWDKDSWDDSTDDQDDDAEYDDDAEDELLRPKKTKESVSYSAAKKLGETCDDCLFFNENMFLCSLVEGRIDEDATCDLFQDEDEIEDETEKATEVAAANAHLGSRRTMMEPPAWIPYLPKPGKYNHPVHGVIKITPDRVQRFITNFNSHIYQDRIPIDAEHQTKLSGAYGWGDQMRMNAEGGADLHVDWTDNGQQALRANRFLFFSPEWFEEWENPATRQKYRDVAIGGALTTRPFFKPDVLRPLAASEAIVRRVYLDMPTLVEGSMAQVQVQMSEPIARRFAELEQSNKGLVSEVQTLRQMNEAQAEQLSDLAGKNKAMEEERRRARFNELTKGWPERNKQVAHLEYMADTMEGGEGSQQFQEYVGIQQAIAKQLKHAGMFSAVGSDATTTVGSAVERINKMAATKAKESQVDLGTAMSMVFSENPDLYDQYREESRQRAARAGKAE